MASHLAAVVQGEEVEISDEVIRQTVDVQRLLKEYRLKSGVVPKLVKGSTLDRVEQGQLERAVCAAMVIKYIG